MLREYHNWHSPTLGRNMELLTFGHAGARVLVFPTSCGRFFDWENRGMLKAVERHIEQGWIQVFCVDGVDEESWFNTHVPPVDRARRHLQYQEYVINEVLPFVYSKNENQFTMAIGASFGAYHSYSIALRYPERFNRVLGMSGVYDVREWTDNQMDDGAMRQGSPCEYLLALEDHAKIEQIRKIEFIMPIGVEDPLYPNNQWMSQIMWDKGIWHAFRPCDGFAHDWPQWYEMIQDHIGGADSRG